MDLEIDKIETCCRTCMGPALVMFDIFSSYDDTIIAEVLTSCTSLKVDKDDSLPQKLCENCYKQVIAFTTYRKRAEEVDTKLRASLFNKHAEVEIKQESKIYNDELYDDNDNYSYYYLDQSSEEIKEEISETVIQKDKKFSCSVCLETFKKLLHLKEHMRKKHPNAKIEAQFTCKVCNKTFKHHNKLLRHKAIHSTKPFPCLLCPDGFKRENLLQAHLIIEHSQHGDIKPELLNEMHSKIKDIKIEDSEIYLCNICSCTFDSAHSLAAHKKKHTKPGRILACSVCGKVFKKMSHLKRHELTHEVNRPFKCCLCTKSYVKEEDLLIHMDKHKGISTGPYKCAICGKEVSHKSTLAKHIKIHTGEKPYLCTTCGKRFDSSNNLKQHMRRHVGEKPFECRMCPKKFISKGELTSHMVTHTGLRAWTCDQCGSSFTKSTTLSKHKMRHLGVKPHLCDACPMRFATKDHLKRHYRIHTGEKPYRCDICERAFSQSNDLVKHKRSHLGDKLYKCDQCPEGFRLKTELRQHISEHYLASKLNGTENINDINAHISKDIAEFSSGVKTL